MMMISILTHALLVSLTMATPAMHKRQAETPSRRQYYAVPNYNMMSAPLKKIEGITLEECQAECDKAVGCIAIVYFERSNPAYCELKNQIWNVHSTTYGSSMYIPVDPTKEYIRLRNVDAENPNNNLVITRYFINPDLCEFLCNHSPECEMISIDKENPGCWLMKKGGNFRPNVKRDFKILKSNFQALKPKNYLLYPNYQVADDNVAFIGAATYDKANEGYDPNDPNQVKQQCEQYCNILLMGCTAFYHEKVTRTCRFFGEGYETRPAKPEDQRDMYIHQFKPGMTYMDIKSLDIGSEADIGTIDAPLDACNSYCDNMPTCIGFSYKEEFQGCILKKSMASRKVTQGVTFRLAVRSKEFLKYANYESIEAGALIEEKDPAETDLELAKQSCEKHCTGLDECKAFDMEHLGSHKCRFYRDGFKAGVSQPANQRDLYISKAKAQLEFVDIPSLDVQAEAADIGAIQGTLEECNAYCGNMPECIGYSYKNDSSEAKECILKRSFEKRGMNPNGSFRLALFP